MSALVVGATGAIGSAVVERLQTEGRTVHTLDRRDGVDGSNPEQVAAHLAGLDGPVDQLVHVAGSVGHGGLLHTEIDEWQQILADSLTSSFVVCRAVVPLMIERGGSVVLMSSVNGRGGGNALSGPAYAAAKAGVIALARNMAKEFGPHGIRTNVVAPGPVTSAMTERLSESELEALVATVPVGRVADPGEIADAVAYLLGDTAGFVNGAVLDINGGMWMG